jgi:hypothetical protein
MAYDDVNLLEGNVDVTKKNAEAFIDASKRDGLEFNPKETEYMLLSRHQN